jgi:CD2 antigen cytoplasmic tail-binding protein 2
MSSRDHRPKGRVRFSGNVSEHHLPKKDDDHDHDDDDDDDDLPVKKRARSEEDCDSDDESNGLPSSKVLLEAKRKRRLLRHQSPDEDEETTTTTHINKTTSLMEEEKSGDIPIEAFNMDAEKNDGSGFFDETGTYVFRKRNPGDEPDAWLETLGDEKQDFVTRLDEPEDDGDDMDNWTNAELYAKMMPLVSDSESVLQALVRYGDLMKRSKKGSAFRTNVSDSTSWKMAQSALNDLTEAANALLLKGDVDVYQMTRHDIMKKLPEGPAPDRPKVQWEYQGNQDHQVHGPYTTQEMLDWTQAGYFTGEQAVQIRTIKEGGPLASKSTKEELLSDLMDEDDQDEQTNPVKGEWVSSNDVDFTIYS